MNKHHDSYLVKAFPNLFANRYSPMTETAMCWGFECGDGWYKIIEEAAGKLEQLILRYKHDYPYRNEFPSWIFGQYNWRIDLQWRCYSFLAIWDWALIGLGLRQPKPWWPRAAQVKEKFGTLRFYMTHSTEEMDKIIGDAVQQSASTCEICGRPGHPQRRGWLYTA